MDAREGGRARLSLSGRPVVVLGMFRSGTSIVSGALAELGYFFGNEQDFFPADEYNQTGYWELRDLMAVNRRALAALRLSYHRVDPVPDGWRELPEIPAALRQIESALEKHFSGRTLWGWKEPMTSVLLPLYLEVLEKCGIEPHFAICVRNPLDVAASEKGREPLMGDRALGLWLGYTLGPLAMTQGKSRSVIRFEDFMGAPKPCLQPIVDATGICPNDSEWDAAVKRVQPGLRHHRRARHCRAAKPKRPGTAALPAGSRCQRQSV